MMNKEKKKNTNKTKTHFTRETVMNRYEVRLEYKNTDNEYLPVKYFEPLHFEFLSQAKYFCNDLKFRLDTNERYAVYDTLCNDKLKYYAAKENK